MRLAQKLAKLGLVAKPQTARLGKFLDQYIAGRQNAKHGTLLTMRTALQNPVQEMVRRQAAASGANRTAPGRGSAARSSGMRR